MSTINNHPNLFYGIWGRLGGGLNQLTHNRQQHPSRNHTTQLPRGICAHRVHEDEVLEVFFARHALDDARGHREGADSGGADERVELPAAQPSEHEKKTARREANKAAKKAN